MRTRLAAIIGFLGIALAAPNAVGEDFVWAKRIGGTLDESAQGVAADTSGNVYALGYFQGTADFDPGPGVYNLTSAGGSDVFVVKFDSTGNLLWAKRIGGAFDDRGYAVALGIDGTICTVGYFQGTADFDPGSGINNLTSAGGIDAFVLKLDTGGNFVWAGQLGGTQSDEARGLALDGGGSVFIVGAFQGTADLDPGSGTYNLTAAGITDAFVSKLDSAGHFAWANRLGGTNSASVYAYGVAVDTGGIVYTVGGFRGTADFDPGPGTHNLTSAGFADAFISKLGSAGNFLWAQRIGGALNDDAAFAVALGANGSTCTVGSFSGTVDFDPGPGTFNMTSVSTFNAFVSKLDLAGNFVWAKQLGGSGSDYDGVAVDTGGNVYTVNRFYDTADFDPGPGTYNLTAPGFSADAFVSKLDGAGSFAWAGQLGGSGSDAANSVAVDSAGNLYTVGRFQNTADFDPGLGTYNLTSAGGQDAFVVKLGGCRDSDDDGLCDSWETDGIDTNGDGTADVHLWDLDGDGTISAAERADPNVPDVYVELDWMTYHAPARAAVDRVIESFAHAPVPVRLHVQRDENAVAHADEMAWTQFTPGAIAGELDFDSIKADHFGTASERAEPEWPNLRNAKRFVFHYGLFVHGLKGRSWTGVGEGGPYTSPSCGGRYCPGNDLVVSLGKWYLHFLDVDKDAVAFMHELGHNLGLAHGGGDETNCKPNYLSIMNYTREWNNEYVNNRPLDYSRRKLPTLYEWNENAPPSPHVGLAESSGIGGSPGDHTAFGPPSCRYGGQLCQFGTNCGFMNPCETTTNVDARGSIDWNRDGDSTDVGLSRDINQVPSAGCGADPNDVLDGFDDWSNLIFSFQKSPFFADASKVLARQENSDREEREYADALTGTDSDGDGIANIFDRCPFMVDPNQTDSDGDGAGDGCDCNPLDAVVYPGAPEVNDGKDNQCPGEEGYGLTDEISIAYYRDPAKAEYAWYLQEGATYYDVARSNTRSFTECTLISTDHSFWDDPEVPSAGAVFYYLVRASAPHVGTWGKNSAGVERTVGCAR